MHSVHLFSRAYAAIQRPILVEIANAIQRWVVDVAKRVKGVLRMEDWELCWWN